ncbi:hypothetical protein [Nocardia flavorosea]|uniref:Uncharacterized protein n=1 Tax=Nocardia flavorosea TaxID=53429 RepID=A0A846YRZ2_9NOCA|nr:hypothetical protein [Nocardia flavorosea]NKY59739.1 hypothetical protein [Nocardia flavorosea]
MGDSQGPRSEGQAGRAALGRYGAADDIAAARVPRRSGRLSITVTFVMVDSGANA